MAVTYDNQTFVSFGTVTEITTSAFTITSASNRAAIVALSYATNGASAITASVGAVGGTAISGADSTTAQTVRTTGFAVIAPPSGSQTATITWTTATSGTVAVMTASGVNQTTPVNNGTFTSNTSGNPSLSVTSVSGDLTVDWVAMLSGTASAATQTERYNDTTSFYGAGSTGPGTGSATHGWTSSGGAWTQSGANFVASVGDTIITPGVGSLPFTGRVLDAFIAMSNDARIVIRKA